MLIVRILIISFLILKGAFMNYTFHYLLMANHMMLQKDLLTSLKNTELSLGQPKVLDYLKDHNGAGQKEIASACHIEPASLTSILNRMEKQEIIHRKNLNGNRRSLYVFLTPKGEKLSHIVSDSFETLESEIFENIPDAEKTAFMNTFAKIYENMRKRRE